METKEFPRDLFTEALNDVGEVEEAIREDYTGRSMYGHECFAVVLPNKRAAYKLFVALGAEAQRRDNDSDTYENSEVVDNLVEVAEIDNLGYDLILYFPGWTLSDGA